jgi:DivIVA domain-containing protein
LGCERQRPRDMGMIDDSFHLTPLDVRRTDFPAALRGYDKARVDEFRDRVANELERLTRLNQELETKARGFHEQLRAFRERDKALNEALVSAQQLRAETRDQAEREAQLVLREARAEGGQLVDVARADVRRLAAEIEGLERARRAYLAQLRAMVARQLAELDAIPEVTAGIAGGGSASGGTSAASPAYSVGSNDRATVVGAAGSPAAESSGRESELSPPPSPPTASPPNGADSARAESLTPAWLNAVPAE